MADIGAHFIEIGLMDRLATKDTAIHRLDPRAKLLTTLVFVATVVSFGKYEVSALLSFFVYPIALIARGDIPARYILKKIILVAPFAILVGVFNPFLDREPLLTIGDWSIAGGWISLLSILVRFILTVGAALILLACTGINGVCLALEKLGVPRVFTAQLLFMYRYLFVIMEEGMRMVRAKRCRSFSKQDTGMKAFGHMLGHLLLRSLDRAQRIHSAMSCRGFDGHIPSMKQLRLTSGDVAFVAGWSGLFIIMRLYNISQLLGSFITEVIS